MNRRFVIVALISVGMFAHADVVQLGFELLDYDGMPIKNAEIQCATRVKPLVPFARTESKTLRFNTGDDGRARASLECWDGFVNCYFKATGYYPEEVRDIRFSTKCDEGAGKYRFIETEKNVCIKMRKIVNPEPMIVHQLLKGIKSLPAQQGRFGYDLKAGDWVAPDGNGRVSDFVVIYDWREDENSITCTGAIEFVERGCGAYVEKKIACEKFPVEYSARTNLTLTVYFPFDVYRDKKSKEMRSSRVMKDDEYMVIRSRVKLDEEGNVIAANYSQIQGPIGIGYYFALGKTYFNPKVNDTNLEYLQPGINDQR